MGFLEIVAAALFWFSIWAGGAVVWTYVRKE